MVIADEITDLETERKRASHERDDGKKYGNCGT